MMSLRPHYHNEDSNPLYDAHALIREQRHYDHGTWALTCWLQNVWPEAAWCAGEARGGDPHAYATLCRINAARRLVRREIARAAAWERLALATDVAAAERAFLPAAE